MDRLRGHLSANLVAALAIRARDDPEFKWKVTGQVLMHPSLYSKKLHPIEKYVVYSRFDKSIYVEEVK